MGLLLVVLVSSLHVNEGIEQLLVEPDALQADARDGNMTRSEWVGFVGYDRRRIGGCGIGRRDTLSESLFEETSLGLSKRMVVIS